MKESRVAGSFIHPNENHGYASSGDEKYGEVREARAGMIEIPAYPRPENAIAQSISFFEKMSCRRSIRHFSSESIEREVLLNAIRSAGTAPSGANCQPWYFALIESQSVKDQIRTEAERVEKTFYGEKASPTWLKDLAPLGTTAQKKYLSLAPALIAVFSRQNQSLGTQRNYYPIESTGIAVGILLTSLHNAGLAALTHTPRPLFFLNGLLNLDRTYKPFMLVVVGYPIEPVSVPNIHRKSLEDICGLY